MKYFNTRLVVVTQWILLSDKLIINSLDQIDKLIYWKISLFIHNNKLIFIRTS